MVKLLLDNGVDVNHSPGGSAIPSHFAVDRDNLAVTKLLLDNKALQINGDTRFRMAKFLLEHGADVRMTDTFSTIPLHYTAELCSQSIIKLLLDHGALVNVQDRNGITPLHEASKRDNSAAAKLLLDHGALVNV